MDSPLAKSYLNILMGEIVMKDCNHQRQLCGFGGNGAANKKGQLE
jgi:hypothetical protein